MQNTYEVVNGIKEFILGGDAHFTISQDRTNSSPSYQVKYRVKNNGSNTCWFVSTELTSESDLYSDGKCLVYQGLSNVWNYLTKYAQI